ncbi:MAG: hypothetical protein QOF63_142, partial [Thermoanaerobaculia bacterium]|nr:hypothetical protein [Thermoanaerobaculia bacterium]
MASLNVFKNKLGSRSTGVKDCFEHVQDEGWRRERRRLAGWLGCILAAEWKACEGLVLPANETQPGQPARTVRTGDMVDRWPETWWTPEKRTVSGERKLLNAVQSGV